MSIISSAEPEALIRYSTRMLALDADLMAGSARLAGVLAVFESLCREPDFRVRVNHLPGKVTGHCGRAQPVDVWVGTVGINFSLADQGVLLALGIRDQWLPEWWWAVPPLLWFIPTRDQKWLPYTPVWPPSSATQTPTRGQDLPSNLAELFAAIEDAPSDITIIQINDKEYLILVQGTESWTEGADTWPNAAFTGMGLESDYSERIRRAVADLELPPDATLNFAGHSQGGHAIQVVANRYAATGEYKVRNVIGFGTYFADVPDKRIENAQVYNFANDPLIALDIARPLLVGGAVSLLSNPVNGAATTVGLSWNSRGEHVLFDPVTLNPKKTHGEYEKSRTLQGMSIAWNTGAGYPKVIDAVNSESGPRQKTINDAKDSAAAGWAWCVENVESTSDKVSQFSNSVADSLQQTASHVVKETGETLEQGVDTAQGWLFTL